MNTKYVRRINAVTLAFLYAILYIMACILIIFVRYCLGINSVGYQGGITNIIRVSPIFLGVGMLFVVWFVFRCRKWPLENFAKFERAKITALIIIVGASIIFAIVKWGLSSDCWLKVYDMYNDRHMAPLLTGFPFVYLALAVAIPILLIMLATFVRAKYLFWVNFSFVLLYILATILAPVIPIIMTNGFSSLPAELNNTYEGFQYYFLIMSIPIIILAVLCFINCRLTRSPKNVKVIAAFQRFIGIFGLFLLMFTAFILVFGLYLLQDFLSIIISIVVTMMFAALTLVPYNMYSLASQILYLKYAREQKNEISLEEL